MRKFWLVGLALATALATVPAAKADSTQLYFTISGVNNGNSNGESGLNNTGFGTGPGAGGAGISGYGILTATLCAAGNCGAGNNGLYAITGGYDIVINGQMGSVLPASSLGTVTNSPVAPNSNYISYDDLLKLNATPGYDVVDNNGLAISADGLIVSLWLDGPGDVFSTFNPTTGAFNPVTIDGYNITMNAGLATPEPSSWLLLGSGLFLLAGLVVRKARPGMIRVA